MEYTLAVVRGQSTLNVVAPLTGATEISVEPAGQPGIADPLLGAIMADDYAGLKVSDTEYFLE